MIRTGETVIMTFEELEVFGQRLVVKTIEKLKEDQTIPNVKTRVGIDDLVELWGKSRTTIWRWARRKNNPLPLVNKKIDLKTAEEWYSNQKGTYHH